MTAIEPTPSGSPTGPPSYLDTVVKRVGDNTLGPFRTWIYGESGVGKTTLCATAPSPLILDLDASVDSLHKNTKFHGVPYIDVESTKMLGNILRALKMGEMPEVETVILDNVGELQQVSLGNRMQAEKAKDSSRDQYLPEWTDYRANTNLMRSIFIQFCTLDRNIIITSVSEKEKEEGSGRLYWAPALTPKLRETINSLTSVVGYLSMPSYEGEIDTIERHLQVHPTKTVMAKCRWELPRVLINPTFDDLLKGRTS